jgi:hypothetical protein
MKKQFFLLSFALFLLLMSCNFQIPSAVQIKGSPDFRFSANFNMGDYLEDLFNEEDFQPATGDEIKLLKCEKPPIITYLVYMKLYDAQIPLNNTITGSGDDYYVPIEITLVPVPGSGDDNKLEVPALDFDNSFEGFSLNEEKIKSKIYVSGSEIVDCLSVELKINNSTTIKFSPSKAKSELDGKTTYDGNELPTGGAEIALPFDGKGFTVEYKIYVEAGKTIKSAWMNNPSVLVELAIWLPFEFIAKDSGTELSLPED